MRPQPAYEYVAWLMQRSNGLHPVYDGDTLWLSLDLGFHVYWDIGPCRLSGVDTPEVRGATREQGIAARDFLRELLARPENTYFLVRTDKDRKEKYGRYLVTLILPDGTNVNQALLDAGHAVPADYE